MRSRNYKLVWIIILILPISIKALANEYNRDACLLEQQAPVQVL